MMERARVISVLILGEVVTVGLLTPTLKSDGDTGAMLTRNPGPNLDQKWQEVVLQ
jgi:hypothetical protein